MNVLLRLPIFVAVSLFSYTIASAAPGDITTIAGQGTDSSSGDGGPATDAELYFPQGIAVDRDGHVYVSELFGHRIRKIDAGTGIITTAVGTGLAGFNGDGMSGAETQVNRPSYMKFGPDGALYFYEFSNNRLRRWDPKTDVVTTYLGTGNFSVTGFGLHRTETNIGSAGTFVFLANGDLVFPMNGNNTVVRVDAASGIVSQLLGDGTQASTGDGGPAVDAQTFQPLSASTDSQGNIYIGELRRVRRIDAVTGIVTTVVGDGTQAYTGDGDDASAAQFDYCRGLIFDDADNYFFGDEGPGVIRKIDGITNIITTIAGTGTPGFSGDGGPATSAQINTPVEIAFDKEGNLYFTDFTGRVRKIEAVATIYQRGVDTTIGPKARQQRGRGIINTSAAGQTLSIKSKTKRPVRFCFSVRNSGEGPDAIRIAASKGKRAFRTRYIQLGVGNVTAQLLTSDLLESVASGGGATYLARIKPKVRKGGKRQNLSVLATSITANEKKDVVRAKMKIKLPRNKTFRRANGGRRFHGFPPVEEQSGR